MIQNLLIALMFGAALIYLGRMAYRSFTAKSCASGCGKCGVIDVDKIEKNIRQKELSHH